MTGAFQQFRRLEQGSATERWLEGKLVEAFLARAEADTTPEQETLARDGVESHGPSTDAPLGAESLLDPVEIDPEALFRAAARLPHAERAAIWLVLFRRWRYEEACSVLKTDLAGLGGLLRGGQTLLTAVVRRSEHRNGTDHDRRL